MRRRADRLEVSAQDDRGARVAIELRPVGPALQFANDRSWDRLGFEIYPGPRGSFEFPVVGDRRDLRFRLTVSADQVLLEGGPLDYRAEIRVHRSDSQPLVGQLGRPVALM